MRSGILYIFIVIILASTGCEYQRVVKKGTADEKHAYADKMFDDEKYVKALPLYEELLGTYRRKREGERIYFRFAMCYYQMSDFGIAAYHFKSFSETFPGSSLAEDAAYWYAICQYNKSLPYYLDPTPTQEAIDQLQLFINRYPESKHVESCNEKMDVLRRSLQVKAHRNAMAYYYRELYNAAVVTMKNALISFPDMEEKAELEYLIVECSHLYAKRSIQSKQVERYQDALNECREYLSTHDTKDPNREKVERIKTVAEKELADVKEAIQQLELEKKIKKEQNDTQTTRQ